MTKSSFLVDAFVARFFGAGFLPPSGSAVCLKSRLRRYSVSCSRAVGFFGIRPVPLLALRFDHFAWHESRRPRNNNEHARVGATVRSGELCANGMRPNSFCHM